MATPVTNDLHAGFAYSPMVEAIRQAVASGKLNAGDRLAGEVDLGRQYGISVTSVRRGIETLVRDGLLRRRQGSGTFITAQPKRATRPRATCEGDTVAIVTHVVPVTYHPFFTERLSGLRAGLSQRGWSIWEPERGVDGAVDLSGPPDARNSDSFSHLVGEHPEFAGLVTHDWLVPPDCPWLGRLPVVSMDNSRRLPSAAYCWQDELERGARHLLSEGVTRIWAICVFPEGTIREAVRRAARALDLPEPELHLSRSSDRERTLSVTIRHAFDETCQQLSRLDVDGILVGSDFEAQGVIDALQNMGRRLPDDYRLVAMINRESRLQSPWPLTCLIADGYANGQALAEMLHLHLVSPEQAPRQIILAGRFERRG